MDKEELKKSTCMNLRCVTQSSKDGVPLNQLQNDYKQLLGTVIPFKDIGYNSLEDFVRDIPDVVCLKKKSDGSLIVEGVADASTAHIAKLISKQKSSKKSKSSSTKASVVTRKWGSFVKKNSHQNLKSSQKECNNDLLSSLDKKPEQNTKPVALTPAQRELRKSVLINLRSVVQSCKDGVPLNRLQNDYRRFIGSHIPIQNLGYNTLYEFIQSIPDVIKLKRDINDQYIAIGIVDSTTAHLFGNGLQSKPLKSVSPSIETSQPSDNNNSINQTSSEQKSESSFFKLSQNQEELLDLNSILKLSPTQKKFIKKNKLTDVLPENKEMCSSTEELPLKSTKKIESSKGNSTPAVSSSKTNTGLPNTQCNNTLTINAVYQHELRSNSVVSDISSDQDVSSKCSKSSYAHSEYAKTSFKKDNNFEKVKNQVLNAALSALIWMNFLLYGPLKMKPLRTKILSFSGFPFSKDSKEWKEKMNLLSLLPKKALRQCLLLLCEECKPKDSRKRLQNKLIDCLAAYTEKPKTNAQESKKDHNKKELYASILTLSSTTSDVLPKFPSYADAVLNDKNIDASKTKEKIVSNSECVELINVLRGSSYKQEAKENMHIKSCKEVDSGKNCQPECSTNTKSALQKPSVSAKITSVLQHQSLGKKVEPKEHAIKKGKEIDSGKMCQPECSTSVKSALQKPSASVKITPVPEKVQSLAKKVEPKGDVQEFSKTKSASIVSSTNTKSAWLKPSVSDKITSIEEKPQFLKKKVEQKENAKEPSKAETPSIVSSKKAKSLSQQLSAPMKMTSVSEKQKSLSEKVVAKGDSNTETPSVVNSKKTNSSSQKPFSPMKKQSELEKWLSLSKKVEQNIVSGIYSSPETLQFVTFKKTKSSLQKPSASIKTTSVLEKQQSLGKKVKQKEDAKECSKTETPSIVSSKTEIPSNVSSKTESPSTISSKKAKASSQKPSASMKMTSALEKQTSLNEKAEQKVNAGEGSNTGIPGVIISKSARRNRRRKRKKYENTTNNIGLPVTKPVSTGQVWKQLKQMKKTNEEMKKLLLSSSAGIVPT